MGACNFRVRVAGCKLARTAFDIATNEARYEHGHGGYSGTIAEKTSFREFTVPAAVPAVMFADWIEDAYDNDAAALERVPAHYRRAVREAADVWGDKWGPAVALRDGDAWLFLGLASS